ncbi:MAG: glycosyltransferase [Solirubrobacterales bacterium]
MSGPILQVMQPLVAGVPQHVLALTRGLVQRGWEVDVATPAESAVRDALAEAGARVIDVEMTRSPGPADRAAASALRALDAERRYEIVHAHSSKAGALVRLALPRAERIVYTPHCFSFLAGFSAARRAAYFVIEQMLLPRTGAVIAVSDLEGERAQRRLRGLRSRQHVVRNGIAPLGDGEPDPELVDFATGLPLVGYLSRLDEPKEPTLLVEAAARLVSDAAVPPFRVAVVGNGDQAAEVDAAIAEHGMHDTVRRFDFHGDPAPALRAFDLFVLPTRWEALPLSVLEAMSAGLPTVASAVGGVPELVRDDVTGTLVAPGDAQALAAAVGELVADPQRRERLGAGARQAARTEFGFERMISETEQVYRSVGADAR